MYLFASIPTEFKFCRHLIACSYVLSRHAILLIAFTYLSLTFLLPSTSHMISLGARSKTFFGSMEQMYNIFSSSDVFPVSCFKVKIKPCVPLPCLKPFCSSSTVFSNYFLILRLEYFQKFHVGHSDIHR